jgi:ribosomal-protein-alanine N-acetyltransferase
MKKLNTFVPVLHPCEDNVVTANPRSCLQCISLTPRWIEPLASFLRELDKNGDTKYFCPHPASAQALGELAIGSRQDLYYLLIDGEKVLGYGLLRGWDEGYVMPSLGIAIHPDARNSGLGTALMHFLHAAASRKGATKVRLRVHKDNRKAIAMYEGFGYSFAPGQADDDYWVGIKRLSED